VNEIRKVSKRDMIWHWARAEIRSERFSAIYASLNLPLRELVEANKRKKLTAADWRTLTATVSSGRSPLLKGILRLGTTWYAATLDLRELPQLRLLNLPSFLQFSPTRTLVELVEGLDSQRISTVDSEFQKFISAYRKLRMDFSMEKMEGYPVLIADRIEGPYIILEGYTRLSVLASKYFKRELTSTNITVLLGVCSKLVNWYLNDDPKSISLYQ
jgi:hypothetical protein